MQTALTGTLAFFVVAEKSVGGVAGDVPAGAGLIVATVSSADTCAIPAARTKKSVVAFFILSKFDDA